MSQSQSDLDFQEKYGHAPVKAQVKTQRQELEELRAFRAANEKKISQANASHIEATGRPLPVRVQVQKVDAKANKRAKALAAAKATHDAVNMARADAGLPRLDFDQAYFDFQFSRLHGDDVLRVKASDPDAVKVAMAKIAGQKLSANSYKTPAQLAAETRNMTKDEQQAAMNAAVINELRKLQG
ncbi:hypothetical protein [Pantoea dispersa]|uniref:hypothetical protein n=1 Tax=Pantoea dispersa TaxID=59814 RepID=UPI0024AEC42F|nr:hypothetical protein [Pantoea dispersa]MDI6637120.1 hypothetical protein [Pantoea dispersa]